ncbi:MAG: VanW family protein [Firmicutes bacterium]|nr:VanW family protein [Bacillota bacterium]
MDFGERNKKLFVTKRITAAILSAAFVFGLSGCKTPSKISGVTESITKSETKMEDALAGDTIYKGITIEGADVSGMTEEECVSFLKEKFASKETEPMFTAAYNDKSWNVTPEFLGTTYDYEGAAKEAYEYARTGSTEENYKAVKALEENPVDFELQLMTENGGIESTVERIAGVIDVPAVDASIQRTDSGINITQDSDGYAVNQEATVKDIKDMIASGFSGIYVINTVKTEPAVRKADLDGNFKVLGSYYTSYSNGDWGRNENMRIASANINGSVVQPGEIFSSYKAMGDQTLANGYQYAGVIENGVLTSGVGGGVCQVSTTLYNAVIRAELEVVERRNHSLKIGYVPAGMDAAIAGTYTDFKFKNNTKYPVYVEMYTANNKVYANIYGYETRPANRTIDFESVYVSSVAKPAEKITYDPDLPEGQRVVTKTGSAGSVIDVYKLVYINGNLESREYFNRSTYSATADEVTIGQKKVDAAEPAETTPEENNTAEPENNAPEPENNTPAPENNTPEPEYNTPEPEPEPDNGGGDNNPPQFQLVVDEDGNEVYVPVE